MSAVIPDHNREEYTQVLLMELSDHLFHTIVTTGHACEIIQLIAVIDPDVGISRPDEYGIKPAVTFAYIVQEAVNRILFFLWIIEISVVRHYLCIGIYISCPRERLQVVESCAEGKCIAEFCPPAVHTVKPGLMIRGGSGEE